LISTEKVQKKRRKMLRLFFFLLNLHLDKNIIQTSNDQVITNKSNQL